MKKRIYFAYGSNMSISQMTVRCPGATLIGFGRIENYKLLFKGSMTGSYATIEPCHGEYVPIWVWDITPADESNLDRYEGFPRFYYKADLPAVTDDGEPIDGMAYIMHEDRACGIPSMAYYKVLFDGYEFGGFDLDILRRGFMRSYEATMEANREDLFY